MIIGIPIASFDRAKQRLAGHLHPAARRQLARDLAGHTCDVVAAAGFDPTVVSSAADVAEWAGDRHLDLLAEPDGSGLNGAARRVVDAAGTNPWMILHADLPCLVAADVSAAAGRLAEGAVVSPSYDGGTTLLGGRGEIAFAYGPSSFHRHVRAIGGGTVLTSVGLQLDIDGWTDLQVARRHPAGTWLAATLPPAPDHGS